MAELNAVKCADSGQNNTGIPACFLTPKQVVGIILTPVSYKIAAADMSDLLSTLQGDCLAGAGARIYPLLNFVALDADNSEAPTKQNFGYGFSLTVRDGNYVLSYQYTDGGLCLHKQLRMFNGKKWGALLVDADGVIYGYKNGSDLQAIPLIEFYAAPWKVNDGSNVTKFTVEISFRPQYLNEFVGFIATADEFDILTSVTGIINLVIKQVTALAAGVVKVQVIASCGGANMYDLYKAALTQKAAWQTLADANGDAIAISTVVGTDADKSITITMDTEDENYPAAAGKIDISLVDAATLAAAPINMSGFESNVLVETV